MDDDAADEGDLNFAAANPSAKLLALGGEVPPRRMSLGAAAAVAVEDTYHATHHHHHQHHSPQQQQQQQQQRIDYNASKAAELSGLYHKTRQEARRERRRLERRAAKIASLYERAVFDYYEILEEQHRRRKEALLDEERAKKAWLIHALEHPEEVLVPIPRYTGQQHQPSGYRNSSTVAGCGRAEADFFTHTMPHHCRQHHLHRPGAVLSGGFLASIRPTLRTDIGFNRAAWRWQLALTLLRYPSLRRERKHYLRRNGFTPKVPLVFDPTGV